MRPKFCYVLPSYRKAADEHFIHTVDFLRELARRVDLCVIVERGEGPDIPGARVFVLPQQNVFRRVVALVFRALSLRQEGYRKFFARISIPAALPLSLLRPFGIQTYYWNSGMAKEAKPGWTVSWKVIKEKLFSELPFALTLRFCYRLVTGPERMGRYYCEAYGVDPRKVIICYNDINLERFSAPATLKEARQKLGLSADRKVILSVHRHSPLRRPLWYYPEIICQVVEKDPTVLFVLIGGGPQEPELRAAITATGLDPNVLSLGSVPNVNLPLYFAASDLFIMPSWIEGFPRVLLEAMAMGTPFVTTDAGGVEDILTSLQRRFMVSREDRQAFVNAVVALLADSDLSRQLAADGREQVKRFSTETVVQMYMERVIDAH